MRKALESFFNADAGISVAQKVSPKSFTLPDDVHAMTPRYRGWGSGDLREELRRQFKQFLACAVTCRKFYPRTQSLSDLYEGLISLYQDFEAKKGV